MKLSSSNRTYITLVATLLVVIGIIAAYLLTVGSEKDNSNLPSQADATGIVVCLPHKESSGPQTLECAYGLRNNEGTHYGLKDLPDSCNQADVGTRLRVSGPLSAPEAGNIYDIIGVITVQTCTKE